MTSNAIFFGNGDFRKCIQMLQAKRSSEYKDLANKMVLLKTGHLYHKDEQVDVNDPNDDNVGIQLFKSWGKENMGKRMPLYSDKSYDLTPANRAVNHKHVFKVWSKQVFEAREVGE